MVFHVVEALPRVYDGDQHVPPRPCIMPVLTSIEPSYWPSLIWCERFRRVLKIWYQACWIAMLQNWNEVTVQVWCHKNINFRSCHSSSFYHWWNPNNYSGRYHTYPWDITGQHNKWTRSCSHRNIKSHSWGSKVEPRLRTEELFVTHIDIRQIMRVWTCPLKGIEGSPSV